MFVRHASSVGLVATAILLLSVAPSAFACVASPNPVEETQPDGTRIILHFKGDKFFHWYEDEAGYTVMRTGGGLYVHAALDKNGNLVPTKSRVGLDDPAANALVPGILPPVEVRRQIAAKVMPTPEAVAKATKGTAPFGTVKNLVILARFSDHGGRALPSPSDFGTLFNAVGGHPTIAPTGSVRDAYAEMSYGQMILQSTIAGWVTLPQTEAYYANGNSGSGARIDSLIRDALTAADSSVDFASFDTDSNGYVDSIAFVHSGYGAEWGGTDAYGADYTNRIWSHRGWLNTGIGEYVSAEGVRVYDYHINPGVWATSGSAIGRIGVICHETGHYFGLPDLYDGEGGEGIGSWCMMGNSWGFAGDQYRPPHFSPWCKIALGWLTPTTITTAGSKSIPQVQTSQIVHKITSNFPSGEYLLVENRNRTSFDADMPVSGGLAIWHIDDATGFDTEGYPGQPGWPSNGNHYRVALLQADGSFDLEKGNNRGDGGDIYRAGGVTTIGPSTVPNTDKYQSGNIGDTGISISSISAGGSTMSYTLSLALSAPEVAVADGGTNIPDGGGPIDFGSTQQGSAALTKTFAVSNIGSATLMTATPTVPSGYSVAEPLSASIAAGTSDTFTISLSSSTPGTFSGDIAFGNNDSSENPFNFTVTGSVYLACEYAVGADDATTIPSTPAADPADTDPNSHVTGRTIGAAGGSFTAVVVAGSPTCPFAIDYDSPEESFPEGDDDCAAFSPLLASNEIPWATLLPFVTTNGDGFIRSPVDCTDFIGSGTGSVVSLVFNAAPHFGAMDRSVWLRIGPDGPEDAWVYLRQTGCSYEDITAAESFACDGGCNPPFDFQPSLDEGCPWSVTALPGWVTLQVDLSPFGPSPGDTSVTSNSLPYVAAGPARMSVCATFAGATARNGEIEFTLGTSAGNTATDSVPVAQDGGCVVAPGTSWRIY